MHQLDTSHIKYNNPKIMKTCLFGYTLKIYVIPDINTKIKHNTAVICNLKSKIQEYNKFMYTTSIQ